MSVSNHGGAQLAEAVRHAYAAGQDDYHLEPMVLTERGIPVGRIRDHDAVVFCCRRGEREIELTELFTADDFRAVERRKLKDLYFAILTLYHDKFKHLPIAFAPEHVVKPLAQVLSDAGKTQFHCAESEKFAHVTFFFNGGEHTPFPGEEDVCVPSPKGIDFDQKPELSLPEVERTVTDALGKYDFIVTNFANGDVIGHTQNTAAKLDACGYVSRALEQVVDAALAQDYVVAITADHGNIEKLYTVAGKPDGSHTTNLVPFILIDSRQEDPISLRDGALCDVAPTILDVMGLPQPLEMTGRSLAEGHAWSRGRRMLLIICDGWGLGAGDEGDAIHLAHTPYWDALLENRSWCRLQASREFVGLGAGKAGNSEAGHSNLGAGRCVMQTAPSPAIRSFWRPSSMPDGTMPPCICWPTSPISPPTGASTIPWPSVRWPRSRAWRRSTSTSSSTAAPPNPAPPPRCWRSWTAAWTRSGWGGSWTALAGAWSWTGTRITTR